MKQLTVLFASAWAVAILVTPAWAAKCPPDSVKVGPVCVDKYEASVWEIPASNKALITKVKKGTATFADLTAVGGGTQHGTDSDNYGAGCPDTGNGCTGFYAVSIAGVTPARFLTWFQAVAACRNADKHLVRNDDWQAAALGTPGGAPCIVSNGVLTGPSVTGTTGCVSDAGAFDMVGNVNELVAEWIPLSTNCPGWFGGFSTDAMCLAGADTTAGPGVMRRGGDFANSPGVFSVVPGRPETPSLYIGFRCSR